MAKAPVQPDVIVLGDHPCTYFAAALLKEAQPALRVLHATLPQENIVDRLVLLSPEFFDLHKSLTASKRALDLVPIHGLKFLSDDPALRSAHSGKEIAAYVASLKQVHDTAVKIADQQKVEFTSPEQFEIHALDESGIQLSLDGRRMHPRLLILGGELGAAQKKQLGLPPAWETDVLHRYTFLKLKGAKWIDAAKNGGGKQLIPMSLDLRGELRWGWMLPGKGVMQIAVVQPADSVSSIDPTTLLEHWVQVLARHGELKTTNGIDCASANWVNVPLAGALAHETVANRTLLIGPAGGFFTACAEDIYPACWSAVFAVDVAKKALKEKHVQDALQSYRHKWGSTLGDFLRGPQQNLRFLMPLIYRNPMMTLRMTEAILRGKSVVR
jgi:hypothetical protein